MGRVVWEGVLIVGMVSVVGRGLGCELGLI